MFTGKLDSSGKCKIPIKALAKHLSEHTVGVMKLEVIAENTYFVPWESEFKVQTKKKVTAEVVTKSAAPMLIEATAVVSGSTAKKQNTTHSDYIRSLFAKHAASNVSEALRLENVYKDISLYIAEQNIPTSDVNSVIERALSTK